MKTGETDFLTIIQVQEILKVSRSKVYRFIKDKKNPLPVIYLAERSPRIKREDLEALDDRVEKASSCILYWYLCSYYSNTLWFPSIFFLVL